MRVAILSVLFIMSCAPIENYDRSHDGCESYCYWCVGYYQHCGDKATDIEIDTEKVGRAVDRIKKE